METNRIFRGFCINRFGIGPLPYILSPSDFGFEFSEIFVLEKRLPDSTIRGVGDSPYQRYAESATLRLNDTGSRRLSTSLIREVDDSPNHQYGESAIEFFKRKLAVSWYGESSTPCIVDTKSHRLPISLSQGGTDFAYHWYGESPTPGIVETGSRRLRVSVIRGVASWKKICLPSIFITLNDWSMPFKDQFGQKLARDVIYYQNRII